MPNRLHASVETRSVDRDNLTVDIVASTFALDTYRTRFDPSGWILKRFLSNPVITWAHDDRGNTASAGLPIANAMPETVRIEDGKLQMRLRFTPEEDNPFGYRVFRLIANGFLHGLSVGFDPIDWDDVTEQVDGQEVRVRIFRKIELHEVAVVTIPSNAETLVKRAVALNQDPEEARRMAAEVERMAEQPSPEKIAKWKGYFEQKQPVNKAASRAMEKFFKTRGLEQPADELAAFTRMTEIIEEEAKEEQPTPPEPTSEETPAQPIETPEQTPEEPEVKPEEPTPTPPQEAPETERIASVRIPLSVLKALPGVFMETAVEAAVRASLEGTPVSQLGAVVDTLGDHILTTLSQSKHD